MVIVASPTLEVVASETIKVMRTFWLNAGVENTKVNMQAEIAISTALGRIHLNNSANYRKHFALRDRPKNFFKKQKI
jgi:hypothetical protein